MSAHRTFGQSDQQSHYLRPGASDWDLMEPVNSPSRDQPITRDVRTTRKVAEEHAQERDRAHAWLHDSVLQVLDLIGADGYTDEPDPALVSRLAAGAADELRTAIESSTRTAGGSLTGEIMRAVHRARARSPLPVRLEIGDIDDSAGAVDAPRELCDAVEEALCNTAEHSSATMVTIRYELVAGVTTVVIADDGIPFEPKRPDQGLGLSHSIVGLRRVGGRATIDSGPGGTRIVLRLRLSEPTS
jgi:signal transduction histidine kinase